MFDSAPLHDDYTFSLLKKRPRGYQAPKPFTPTCSHPRRSAPLPPPVAPLVAVGPLRVQPKLGPGVREVAPITVPAVTGKQRVAHLSHPDAAEGLVTTAVGDAVRATGYLLERRAERPVRNGVLRPRPRRPRRRGGWAPSVAAYLDATAPGRQAGLKGPSTLCRRKARSERVPRYPSAPTP